MSPAITNAIISGLKHIHDTLLADNPDLSPDSNPVYTAADEIADALDSESSQFNRQDFFTAIGLEG